MTTPHLIGRAAIVTGAAQGIGRAVALRLAQDGFDIAANDLDSNSLALDTLAEEIRTKGRKAITVIGDVGKESDVQTLVDRTVAELGEIYVMVANAGIATPIAQTVDLSLEGWNRYISTNLTGVFLCYRAAARQMLKQGHGGRIVGASSGYGKRGQGGLPAYSTTKFGVRGLTQALATELAKERITVNAYAPGFIETPLLHNSVHESDTSTIASGSQHPDSIQAMKDAAPMQRMGTPDDVAGLVSYMVSDAANFMTGQSVSLNGGIFYD